MFGCFGNIVVNSSLAGSRLHLLELLSRPLLLSEPHPLCRGEALHVLGLQELIVLQYLLRLDLFADGERWLESDLPL